MKKAQCPGSGKIRTPELHMKRCPQCEAEVELFSDEMQARCARCGFTVNNDEPTCVRWCRYAPECVGNERSGELQRTFNHHGKGV